MVIKLIVFRISLRCRCTAPYLWRRNNWLKAFLMLSDHYFNLLLPCAVLCYRTREDIFIFHRKNKFSKVCEYFRVTLTVS